MQQLQHILTIMHRYLPGVLLVQIVTLAVFWINLDANPQAMLLQAGLPIILFSLVTALWFASIARADAVRATAKLKAEHAREREKLQLHAERSNARVREQAHKDMRKQERQVSRRANVKVGLAFMGVTAAGVLMLITELLTLGLMTITTAGGAMGGYLLRWRQSRVQSRMQSQMQAQAQTRVLEDARTGATETGSGIGGGVPVIPTSISDAVVDKGQVESPSLPAPEVIDR